MFVSQHEREATKSNDAMNKAGKVPCMKVRWMREWEGRLNANVDVCVRSALCKVSCNHVVLKWSALCVEALYACRCQELEM